MTDIDPAAVLAYCERATAGPWTRYPNKDVFGGGCVDGPNGKMVTCSDGSDNAIPDADFCAMARTDLPALAREVLQLRRAVDCAIALLRNTDRHPIPRAEEAYRVLMDAKGAMPHA